jgi:hypothetical protein
MKQLGFESNGCILGGAQALAKQMACFFDGTEKARRALELSSILLPSRAFWFVLIVATHELVASEKITEDGSKVLGRTEAVRESISKDIGLRAVPALVFPNSISITLLVPRAILLVRRCTP